MRESYILIFALILGSVGHLATDIYLPSLPNLTEYFATDTASVQLTITVYMLSYCFTPLIMGPISDQIGRKKPILIGLGLGLCSTLACMFATSIYLLIIARFLQGIGLGMVTSVSRTILPDNFSGQKLAQNFTYMAMFMPVILAVGPPLGGVIQDYSSWHTVFGFLVVHIIALIFIVKYYYKEKPRTDFVRNDKNSATEEISLATEGKKSFILHVPTIIQSYKSLFKNTQLIRYGLCSVLLFMGLTAYLTVNPFLFQTVYNLTPTQNGCVALILFASTFISGFINSRLIRFYPGKNMLYISSLLILVSGLLLISASQFYEVNFFTFILLVLPFFLTVPIVFSITGSIALSNLKGNFGAATAMISTFQYLGGAISSFLISFANQYSLQPLGITFMILGSLFFLNLISERTKSSAVMQT